jgi:uncharacterized membrane protein
MTIPASLIPLVGGLILFPGFHGLSRWRSLRAALARRLGENGYKGLYSLISLAGLVLVVYGYGHYRDAGMIPVWTPPRGMAHLAISLVWLALIFLFAAKLPGKIRSTLRHPMLAGVKLWALAHLLVNGDLGSILLFGTFLLWAVLARIAIKRSGAPNPAPSGWVLNDVWAILIGTGLTIALVLWLHQRLIGVAILP